MNLFKKPTMAKTPDIPSTDDAQEKVNSSRRGRRMRGRAAGMLVQGNNLATSTASRQVTGN